ncbi:MAG TPA: ABC transporter ATP-binding protein [Ktedonobacterales bacterium]|nr:ABC transporter ATP-binding protein [Ktedonobacterales bacterium]
MAALESDNLSALPATAEAPTGTPPPTQPTHPTLRGLFSADELAALDRHDALVVSHVSKRFAKDGQSTVWLKRLRGGGPEKRRVVRAVDDISLTIRRGEIYGVLGSNGSGKSTLIRLISTLLLPDAGMVRVFGHDVTREERAVQRLINRVSVEAAFFRKLSPMENLLYSARLYGLPRKDAPDRIRAILRRLGIKDDRINRPLEHMSRGMQQKVAIARAFLSSPILLLLDEPTTGLDPRSKQDVQVFVRELRDTHDATILLTTHDMDEADALCDRIAIIDGGRIVAEDTPEGLKRAVGARLGLDRPATLTEAFMAYTGRDWEADEPEDDDEDHDDHDDLDDHEEGAARDQTAPDAVASASQG